VKDRRLGKFSIPEGLFREFPAFVLDILSGMLIIRAELRFVSMGMHVEAYSDYFNLVPDCAIPPNYNLEVIMGKLNMGEDMPEYGPVDWKLERCT